MRSRVWDAVAFLGFLGLVWPLHAQSIHVGPSSPKTPAPSPWSDLRVPYTAEFSQTTTQTKVNGKSVSSQQMSVRSFDSHGRVRYAYTDVSTGKTSYSVDDPVAGRRVVWNTLNRQVKVLNYPQPVGGRKSCWKTATDEVMVPRGEVQLGIASISCAPAGNYPGAPYCKASTPIAASTDEELPVITASYPTCGEVNSGKSPEDLGTAMIQNFEAQGCRTTEKISGDTNIHEDWWIKVVMGDRSASFVARGKIESVGSRSNYKQTEELTFLRLGEPDLQTFQPPEDYELRQIEMQEVPCEEPKQSVPDETR